MDSKSNYIRLNKSRETEESISKTKNSNPSSNKHSRSKFNTNILNQKSNVFSIKNDKGLIMTMIIII